MGPLAGITIIEIAAIGPAPFCGMMLADMGADVIRVERGDPSSASPLDPLARSRRSLILDLKHADAAATLLRMVERADGLIEGFRPGVTENLGIGPDACIERNPGLVYGRMTGWGQEGPLASSAGHDLNYISLTGALKLIGEQGRKPVVPLNLVGDFGGGGMLLAFGMLCGILHARATGRGQVVDAAMLDGAHALMAMFHGFAAMGLPSDETGTSFLGGAAHFYDTYETSDGKFVSVAAIEPQFYETFVDLAGLDRERFLAHGFQWQADADTRADWRQLKDEVAAVFKTKTRDEWCDIFAGTDACVSPVLTLSEAPDHPHNRARDAFVRVGGKLQAAPAPRYSVSATAKPRPAARPGEHSRAVLAEFGFSSAEIAALIESGAAAEAG